MSVRHLDPYAQVFSFPNTRECPPASIQQVALPILSSQSQEIAKPPLSRAAFIKALQSKTEEEILCYLRKDKPNLEEIQCLKLRKKNPKKSQFDRSDRLTISLLIMLLDGSYSVFRTEKHPINREVYTQDPFRKARRSLPGGLFLGEGRDKITYRANDLFTKNHFAIGTVCTLDTQDYEDMQAILQNELKIGQSVKETPHCWPLKAVKSASSKLFAISNVCEAKPISVLPKRGIVEVQRHRKRVLEIIDTIAFLHEKGIIHQDLTLNNLLVSDNSFFLIDFGLSRPITEEQQNTEKTNGGILRDLFTLYSLAVTTFSPKLSTPHLDALKKWGNSRGLLAPNDEAIYPTPLFLQGKFTTFTRELHTELVELNRQVPV